MSAEERNISRANVFCEEDEITYRCAIQSDTDYLHLTWNVTLPGHEPLSIRHEDISTLNIQQMYDLNIVSTLTQYILGEYIESTIVLIVEKDTYFLDCEIGIFESETASLSANRLSKT